MKRILATVMTAFMLLTPMAASAQQTLNTDGLSEQQIADLNAQAAQMKANTPPTPIEKVNEWAEIGAGIGHGLAAAARETGTVVNEFATTPVGKMVTVVIIWKVIGKDIIGILIGVPLLIFVVWGVYSIFNKYFGTRTITRYENGKKVATERVSNYSGRFTEGDFFTTFIAFVGGTGLAALIIGHIIL